MTDPRFVHLRLHTEYSVTDGLVRVGEAVKRARDIAMPALGLSDLSNTFGWVKFYRAARGAGIKPVFGCDVWVTNAADRNRPSRLMLLVQHREGYRRLCELLTRAYQDNLYRGRAEIDPAWLADGTEGLLALSGGDAGNVAQAILDEKPDAARTAAEAWAALFPGRYYLELQRFGQPHTERLIDGLLDIGAALNLPAVATHPIQFIAPDDFKAHEARVCIAEGMMLGDPRRPRPFTAEQYFKTPDEMAELFADLPEALANSVEIAKRCNLTLELGKSRLPDFPTPDGMSLDDYMRQRAFEGLHERMAHLYPDEVERAAKLPEYIERLEFELGTIIQMGFPGYFLIVADFINWAKNNGVPVGPGRGSGAGSLVAYSLRITDLDPLAYDLLFERFLNPERVSMPDFDIDFCQDGRDRVIQYVKERYGHAAVSQIATFGTMAAKAVLRDVGRVLDLPYLFVDKFVKLVPNELGISLAEAREKEPQIDERARNEEELAELLPLAEKLEGITRNVGMHAGGVLIAPGRLTDFCPLYQAEGSDAAVSQFDKDDVEAIGLVKFDFLGLRTLTILAEAVRFVQRHPGRESFQLEDLPLDDPAVYKLFADGNTTAVFQSESRSAKDLEKKLKGDCFEDIIALMALNRPGPLGSGMVDDFIARKQGKQKPEYFHPDLEPVLKSTYGIIVYQEQVMLVAQILAGYSLGAADLLRRAMGKKKPEEMAKQREIFLAGAAQRGADTKIAERLFDLMEKFAEYGFNKSHSAAYALVAYHTAWLKAYYPAEFMAATMSSEMSDTDKVRVFYEDCRANGLTMLPPDINLSGYRFDPVSKTEIRYGLGAIKGSGEAAIGAIVAEREANGPFKGLFDLARRVDKRYLNRRVLEALVKAGAFDAINGHRASLMASVGAALETADRAARNGGQVGLFGEALDGGGEDLIDVPVWPEQEKLLQEKSALGYFFSGHPFTSYLSEVSSFAKRQLDSLEPSRDLVMLAGIAVSLRTQMTRRGKMLILLLDDATAQVEVVIFNELYEQSRHLLKDDALLVIEGKVNRDDYSGGVRVTAERIYDLAGARTRFAQGLRLACNGQSNGRKLAELLAPYKAQEGGCPVWVEYHNPSARCRVRLGEDWRVRLDDRLLESLGTWLKPEAVNVMY
ncbi:DNA polymerase III subunit alpha [Thiobacillus sp.]|uniref:DNA polymerase III subunit alpha n=1 Tax=Thiobacillus sp. TaxID=924 RepID=UPI0017BFDB9F|nr:DNA polymerase III subunit alpha [Thiobacillus sp.]MBC2731599.1 DNA polymerase III subunit alpha [Thiobacillus sp.]MBC2740338.1 DNA polymerase III subunit alpha [Thiobacillus sp.]MBC2759254.1 DNA polymerase III subunit alpha [Thiobacillus sp.]